MDVILQPTPAITFRPIGGILDFFIMMGPSPANVVQQYTSIVGRTFMPPLWSLGFHLCRFGYKTLNKTRETMQRNIDAGINVTVQWNDIDYMNHYKDFTYDDETFKGLPEFVDELHAKGLHYVIMTDPGISNAETPGSYPPYDDGIKDDVFIKNPNGSYFVGKVWTDGELVFPDFSHPNASSWWTKQFQDFYDKVKFDGVWIDMNEPSNFYNGGKDGCMSSTYEDPVYVPGGNVPLRTKTVCMTAKHYNTIHYNEHSLYGYREAAATNHALRLIRNKRPFIISRATFPGQGVHSGHWSGDIASTWEDMRYSISSMLNFNLYGISMVGSDICGFNLNTTVPLCRRWQALGAFYPFSRNHNDRSTIEQDPAALGEEVVLATKYSLFLRGSFLPYLYTLFHRSHVYGDTVVRPLFFEYPLDESTYAIDEQFMWGPALMIIPILYPNATIVNAYLPKGIWSYFDGLFLADDQIASKGERIDIPIDFEIGLFFRAGYILPSWGPYGSQGKQIHILAILDENKEASGELYWDDGNSLETYEAGKYNLLQFSATEKSFTSTVVHSGYGTALSIVNVRICGIDKEVHQLSFNGTSCSRFPQEETDKECFYIQTQGKTLIAFVKESLSLLQPLTISWSY